MNVILCGMMGAGKTTIGVNIAKLTGRLWCDTDQMITEKHGAISDLFEYYGEEYFRRLETELIEQFEGKDGLVISTGGGLVLREKNNEILKKNGKIVFLRAKLETLVGRLKIYEDRPLLQVQSNLVAGRLKDLMEERTPVYEKVADYIVDVDEGNAVSIAKQIVDLLQIKQEEGK